MSRVDAKAYWDNMYAREIPWPAMFGDSITYRMAARFIGDLPVEDWGCGAGAFRLFAQGQYRGIDGSPSRFADEVVELSTYRSVTPALMMRHVIEHNTDWRTILQNALASFQQRMVLIIYTPFDDELTDARECPIELSLPMDDLTKELNASGAEWQSARVKTVSRFGTEAIFYLTRCMP